MTTISIRKPDVLCRFSDGVVGGVPGCVSAAGSYIVANPTGGCMKSFPEEHNKYVNEISAKHRNGGAQKVAQHVTIWKHK